MRPQFFLTTMVILCAASAYAADTTAPDKWQPTMEIEGRVNSDRSIAYPKLLIPLVQDNNSMLFTDLRLRADDQDSQEYNVGLGYRQISDGWIYGGYGFIDRLKSSNDFYYWQGTAGLEALSEKWDLRVNGYLPQSNKHALGGGTSGLTIDGGGNFALSTSGGGFERAMPGFDTEIGYKLPVDAVDLRVFGGAYYFAADGFKPIAGPKARVEMTVGHEHLDALPEGIEFTLGAQYQNDGPREGTGTALAQLRIPLGGGDSQPKLRGLERRMTNFIERDVDIVTKKGTATATTTQAAEVTINGHTYTRPDATVDANTSNINNVLDTTGANGLILVDGAAGIIHVTSDLTPFNGQTVLGVGSTVSATGLSSMTSGTYTIQGTRPTIMAQGGSVNGIFSNFTGPTSSNYMIQGLDLDGANLVNHGIDITGAIGGGQGVTVKDVNITNINGNGVRVSLTAANVTLQDITVSNVVNGFNPDLVDAVTVSNFSVSNASGAAIFMADATNVTGDMTVTNAALTCNASGTNTGSSITINGSGHCP